MGAILPSRWSPGNPVDLVGIRLAGGENIGGKCLQFLLEDNNVDGVISLLPPMFMSPAMMAEASPEQIRAMQKENERNQEILNGQLKQHGKPLVYIRRMSFSVPQGVNEPPPKVIIPEYPHPRRAARVLRYLAGYRKYLGNR